VKIEGIPTNNGDRGYGSMDLEHLGSRIRVEHRIPPVREVGVGEVAPAIKQVLYVPVAELGRLLLLSPEFRFEELTFDEVRAGLDYARAHGWPL
jgi:hypothetical protein